MADAELDDLARVRQERAAAWRERATNAEPATQEPPSQPEAAEPPTEPQAATVAADEAKAEPVGQASQASDGTAPCCRICFETAETAETGRLFSPCKCTGSMRFVHVSCLNSWRAASCNAQSYYRCDACRYEYRLQRLWLADVLLAPSMQLSLTICVFLTGALVGGLICHLLAPWLVDWALDHLRLSASVRFFFSEEKAQGNPACWQGGYTYRLCCGRGHPGNPQCWDDFHNFESCCESPSQMVLWLQALLVRPLRVLLCGGMGLAVVGFALYLRRQWSEAWGHEGGTWQLGMLVAYLSSFGSAAWLDLEGQALGRLVAVVGSAVALKELFLVLSVHCKQLASSAGERVLEVG